MKKVFTITILICMMLIASIAWSATIHVATWGDDETGDGSAGNPYATIQKGIDEAVDGDTVLVADGTYTGDGNRDIDLKGKAITVKSENGADACIIDCEGTFVKPHRGFYFHSGETETSVVDGFTIQNGWIDGAGGGVYCDSSSPTLTNNAITGNTASYDGGGVYCEYYSSPTLTNNTITGNTASYGGGVSCDSSSPTLTNNAITGNTASYDGGGVYCEYYSSPTLTNNTIADNTASAGGGVYCYNYSVPILINCILWADAPQEVYFESSYPNGIVVSYSDVQGGKDGIVSENPGDIIDWGEGNIDEDPLFVDADNGDYHLQAGSPCIDAGTPDGAPDDDLEGNPRDEFPDMGAYEYQGISIRIVSPTDGAEFPAGDVVDVVAEVKDEFDEPMVGVEVTFTATGGSVAPATALTDENGQAVTQLTVAEGENTVTATLTDYPGISDDVTVIGLPLIGSINGHVTDFRGFPLGALVIAVKESIREKTLTESPTGYYEFADLEPGSYRVICIKKGYKTRIKKVEVEAGQVTTCNFVLRRK